MSMTWHPVSEPPFHITEDGEKEISSRVVWLLYPDGEKLKGYYHKTFEGYVPIFPSLAFTCNLLVCNRVTHWAEIEGN